MATATNSSAPSSLEDMDTQQSGLQPSPDSNSKVMMLDASSFNHVCLEHAFSIHVSYLFCVCVCALQDSGIGEIGEHSVSDNALKSHNKVVR